MLRTNVDQRGLCVHAGLLQEPVRVLMEKVEHEQFTKVSLTCSDLYIKKSNVAVLFCDTEMKIFLHMFS